MLSAYTTLELGGPARTLIEAKDRGTLLATLQDHPRETPLFILGGGSNVVISDDGFPGTALLVRTRGVRIQPQGAEVLVQAQAGEPWDHLVAQTIEQDLAGLECLSGIPGLCGASPIQNVGAYGQEVADCIRSVEVFDRDLGQLRTLAPDDCEFAYRNSLLKRTPGRFVVLSVTFALIPGGAPTLKYAELQKAVQGEALSLRRTREAVLALRRKKSMVLDPQDPNRRSAGSFFTNPIVPRAKAQALAASEPQMPQFPAAEGYTKLSAGWLIERAGYRKGHIQGAVGLSTNHALALINRGGGTAQALLELAKGIIEAVEARFGITLRMEPVLIGPRSHVEALSQLD